MNVVQAVWREVALRDICEFRYGKGLPEKSRMPGAYPVYGSNGPVGTHAEALTAGPTIIVGRKGSIGEVSFSPAACWPIDTTYFIDSSCTRQDLRWLSRVLGTLGLTELNKSAAVPGLNRDDAYRQKVLLPPLAEQRRIAAILDEADALRAKRRAALAQLDEMARAIFVEMFGDPATNPRGWPVGRIGDLIASADYGTSAKAGGDGTLPILRMNNITYSGALDLRDLKYIDLGATEFDRYTVRRGDLLFNRTNSPDLVGKTAVFDRDTPMAFAGYLVRLRANDQAAPEYVSAFLNSSHGKAVLRAMCKTIIGMANINAKEVQRIAIPKPPRALQDEYAARLRSLAAFADQQRRTASELDSLFASLQHRAFRGAL